MLMLDLEQAPFVIDQVQVIKPWRSAASTAACGDQDRQASGRRAERVHGQPVFVEQLAKHDACEEEEQPAANWPCQWPTSVNSGGLCV